MTTRSKKGKEIATKTFQFKRHCWENQTSSTFHEKISIILDNRDLSVVKMWTELKTKTFKTQISVTLWPQRTNWNSLLAMTWINNVYKWVSLTHITYNHRILNANKILTRIFEFSSLSRYWSLNRWLEPRTTTLPLDRNTQRKKREI